MEDELSGNLKWDEGSQCRGTLTLASGKIVAFGIDGDETDELLPEAARNTLRLLIANEPLVRHKIAVSLRNVYNDTWLDENTLTPEELAQKIDLNAVEVLGDGSGELYYTADMDLFAGHWVHVPIDANGELGEPEIEG
jgi:hypothetical protein